MVASEQWNLFIPKLYFYSNRMHSNKRVKNTHVLKKSPQTSRSSTLIQRQSRRTGLNPVHANTTCRRSIQTSKSQIIFIPKSASIITLIHIEAVMELIYVNLIQGWRTQVNPAMLTICQTDILVASIHTSKPSILFMQHLSPITFSIHKQ